MKLFSQAYGKNPYRNPEAAKAEQQSRVERRVRDDNARKEYVLVYIDTIDSVLLEVREDDTIGDIKRTLRKYMEPGNEVEFFLNRKTKLDIEDEFDKNTLKSVWKYMDEPSIFLTHKTFPIKPVYGYPKPKYQEIF